MFTHENKIFRRISHNRERKKKILLAEIDFKTSVLQAKNSFNIFFLQNHFINVLSANLHLHVEFILIKRFTFFMEGFAKIFLFRHAI
jgi:hypothetical protein